MTDCLIIGGGIIGLTTARRLVMSGFKVTLVDKQKCGQESSWAGAGILTPLYPWKYSNFVNKLSFDSQKQYANLCQELLKNTKIDPEYLNSGLLMMDEFESETAKKWLKKFNINYQLTPKGALFDICQVRNPKILQALKKDLELRGVEIFENTQVSIKYLNNVATCQEIPAKNIIICAGSWSSEFGGTTYPVRGQVITLKDDSSIIKNIILKDGKYIVPRQDGVILIGSTMENVGFDRTLSDAVKIELFEFASAIFPHLKNCPITNHWCGFRPGNDFDPVIKESDKYPNLYFNYGHFRNGLNTAIASSDIILNLIKNK